MLVQTRQCQEVSRKDLSDALGRLRQWLSDGSIDLYQPFAPSAVYTASVTVWLLVLQRLGQGKSLSATVKDFVRDAPSFVPDNKRIRDRTLSLTSSSYSNARQRLSLPIVRYSLERIADSIIADAPATFHGDRVFILDGTTMTLAPSDELRQAFPPATNQHGETVWPVMMLMVAHEMETGCAICPTVGPMYGSKSSSELKLASQLLPDLPANSTVLGDAGFGIFSLVFQAARAGHQVVCRLSKSRFESLTKKADSIEKTADSQTWKLNWQPTAKDRKTTNLPDDAAISVRIHALRLDDGEWLYLVTTREESCQEISRLYARRYDVETDIGFIKVQMETEKIRALSKEMVLKELYSSLIAYNLVIQFRRQASQIAGLPPRRLSFTGVWNTMESFLLRSLFDADAENCSHQYGIALNYAAKDILPVRRGRHYPRKAHPRRPKTTKWQKQQRIEVAKLKSKPPD